MLGFFFSFLDTSHNVHYTVCHTAFTQRHREVNFFPIQQLQKIILALGLLSCPENNSQFIMFGLPQISHFYKRLA